MRQLLARAFGGVAILALVAGAAACNSSKSDDKASGGGKNCGYEIGFFGALTGSAANLGVNIKNGSQLAVNQYNDKHKGCEVTLKTFDSEGDPAKAPSLARDAVNDKKLLGVIGPAFSGESEAADPIFNEAGLPIITPSATRTSLAAQGWKIFHRGVANDGAQGPAAGRYIKNVLKAEKVFVVDDQSAYGVGLTDGVKATLGSTVVGTDKVGADGKQTDFSATITKIKASGATVLFYGGYYQNAGLIAKQLKANDAKVTLVGADGVKDPGYIETAGKDAAEGSVLTCPCAPADKAGGSFVADYTKAWGGAPGTYSDVAFDAANIFLAGIAAGNTTTDKMQTYLGGLNYQGVANTYKFTDKGELDPSFIKVWAFKVQNGAIVPDQEIASS